MGDPARSEGREALPGTLGCRIGCIAVLLVILGVIAFDVIESWGPWRQRSRAPTPDGLILQIQLREVVSPFDAFEIVPIDREGPAIAVVDDGTAEFPPTLIVVRYPSGEVLERVAEPSEAQLQAVRARRRSGGTVPFDFDGDGTADELVDGREAEYGWVHVRSGADGCEVWSSYDLLEYETYERLTPLGDLDGNGCAELAVLHPRMDRSSYDLELLDALLGVHSWLSVVSGARATR